jgi:hypothetical protein
MLGPIRLALDFGAFLAGAQLHPQSFPQYDPLAEVQQFYQQMYGLNAEFVAAEIQPVFRGDLP